jgi:hypothetical protein
MEVRYIITEEEAQYMEHYKGHFSKKMAEWAISMMERDGKRIEPYPLEEVESMIAPFRNKIGDECIYDCWYVANMARADLLGSSLPDKTHVALYVKDTLCDPDGSTEFVFACFRAKMDVMGIPIMWERML